MYAYMHRFKCAFGEQPNVAVCFSSTTCLCNICWMLMHTLHSVALTCAYGVVLWKRFRWRVRTAFTCIYIYEWDREGCKWSQEMTLLTLCIRSHWFVGVHVQCAISMHLNFEMSERAVDRLLIRWEHTVSFFGNQCEH